MKGRLLIIYTIRIVYNLQNKIAIYTMVTMYYSIFWDCVDQQVKNTILTYLYCIGKK
ncbi:hypothetical protein KTT_05300 [Tengunoibacter tsumagoiensis]|uniref:Uncharacterized protein n=1 Tax=Tengunoibacter tsumagoiensis TaxID=2014871 RepID=A0A401ZUU7_9CHLR|nr:hypothetical protein KTT_05300 [Tengunoibacter tsumagoiensis]